MLVRPPGPPTVPGEAACGGDQEWNRWVPSMWQALADPDGAHLWRAYPEDARDAVSPASWWTPCLHLLLYSLAWPHPDVGLRRWLDAGRPTGDLRLALIAEMLGDRVDELAAWAWDTGALRSAASDVGSAIGAVALDADAVRADPEWLESVAQRYVSSSPRLYTPGSGFDELHVSFHATICAAENGERTDLLTTDGDRTAVFVTHHYASWYRSLAELGSHLPPIGSGRSWHLYAVCTPIGHLGRYRRSRVTGRWFAGPHRVHQAGNAHADDWALA